ncbi:MAG: DUF4159 domain-containing protein, partial [Bradymonadaceae bacterium]
MDRRTFLQTAGLALAGALTPATSAAIGEHSRVTIARLNHGGPGWDQRPTALRRLLQEVSKRTSVSVDSDYPTLSPSDRALFEHPFLTMTGSGKFDPLPDAEIDRLRTYLGAGGFLFIDSAEGIVNGSFMSSVRRMVGRVFPGEQLGEVPADHVLYKSFYLIDDPVGRPWRQEPAKHVV